MEKCVTPTPGLLPATPIIRGWGKLPFLQNAPLFFCLHTRTNYDNYSRLYFFAYSIRRQPQADNFAPWTISEQYFAVK